MTAEETVDWLASLSSETLDLLALEISEPQTALAHAKSLLAIWLETGEAVRDVIGTWVKEEATPAPVSQTLPIRAANDGGSRIAASLRRLLPFGSFGRSVGGGSVDFGEAAAASPGDIAGERSMESVQRELDAWMSMFARYEEEVKEYEKEINALREQVKILANGSLGGNAEERGQDAQTVETLKKALAASQDLIQELEGETEWLSGQVLAGEAAREALVKKFDAGGGRRKTQDAAALGAEQRHSSTAREMDSESLVWQSELALSKAEADSELGSANRDITRLKKELAKTAEYFENKIEAYDKETNEMKEYFQTEIRRLQQQERRDNGQATGNQEISRLKHELSQMQTQVTGLLVQVKTAENARADLLRLLQAAEANQSELHGELMASTDQIAGLQENLKHADKLNKANEMALGDAINEIQELKEKIEDFESMQDLVSSKSDEVKALQMDLARAEKSASEKVRISSRDLAQVKKELALLSEGYEKEISEYEKEREFQEERFKSSLQKMKVDCKIEVEQLKLECARKQEELEKKSQEAVQLQNDVTSLESDIECLLQEQKGAIEAIVSQAEAVAKAKLSAKTDLRSRQEKYPHQVAETKVETGGWKSAAQHSDDVMAAERSILEEEVATLKSQPVMRGDTRMTGLNQAGNKLQGAEQTAQLEMESNVQNLLREAKEGEEARDALLDRLQSAESSKQKLEDELEILQRQNTQLVEERDQFRQQANTIHATTESGHSQVQGCRANCTMDISMSNVDVDWTQRALKQMLHRVCREGPSDVIQEIFETNLNEDGGGEPGVLGVTFDMECTVIEIVPNSPAHICGRIAIGDRLLQVDGKDAIMASSPCRSEAHLEQLCFGLVGSTVHLVLASRGAAGEHREMPLGESEETVASNAIERTKHIDLTRVSASEVMISNFTLEEAVNMLERFVNLVVAHGCAV